MGSVTTFASTPASRAFASVCPTAAQQTFDDEDGYRFTALLTDQPEDDLALLDQRHRAHARVEQRIRACPQLPHAARSTFFTLSRSPCWATESSAPGAG
jgi:hypothetical protein